MRSISAPDPHPAQRALFLSDLVRSTDLLQELGDQRTAEMFRSHDRLARDLLTHHGGIEIDKSDGFLLLFEDPAQGVLYSLDYHAALADLAVEWGTPLAARVSIHFAEVLLYENPQADVKRGAKPLEVEGLAKPLAARLMSLALPGQTLLTQSAFELAQHNPATAGRQLEWLDHGLYRVQGLIEPVGVYEVGIRDRSPLKAPPGSGKVRRLEAEGTPSKLGIVVLPFEMNPPDSDNDHFSEGLTDEIIADLSKVEALSVLARSSAAQLKATPDLIADLKKRLDLRFVLEGAVRRFNEQLRITVKLFDTEENQQLLWADKFSGSVSEFFDIQETISQTVVKALQLELSTDERQRIHERPIPNMQAYEYYLRAKREITRFRGDSIEKVVDYLREGMGLMDDGNILLNSAMGYAYFQYFNAGITTDRGYLDKAKVCAQKILAREPGSAHGHRLLGLIAGHEKDLPLLVKHLKLALSDDPNDTDSLFFLALMYGYVGRPGTGFPLAEKLLEIDPLTPFYNCLPGWLLLLQGDLDLSARSLRIAYEMDRDSPILAFCYAHSLAFTGRTEEACETFGAIVETMPGNFHAQLAAFFKPALQGRRDEALSLLTPELQEVTKGDFQYSWHVAEYLALLEQYDDAIDWLENAVDLGFVGYPLFSELDPLLENLRPLPRYQELMGRVRSLWQQFEG